MSTTFSDLIIDGVSGCCSARVIIPDVCLECKEHCEIVEESDEDVAQRNEIMDR